MSRLKDYIIHLLGGRSQDEYNDLWRIHRSDQLVIASLNAERQRLNIVPVQSMFEVDARLTACTEDIDKMVKERFADEIGKYLVENDLVSITSGQKDSYNVRYVAFIKVVGRSIDA